jgi:hypothetical protein
MKKSEPQQDLSKILREAFTELHIEAQRKPLDLKFPPEVTETLEAFAKINSVDGAKLIPLAMKAHCGRLDVVGEDVCRLMHHPDSFQWPLEDPILCVAIAFMRKLTNRCAVKVQEKFGLTDDELDPADWWKRLG